MGISTNVYTVYGVKLPYDSLFTDALYEGEVHKKLTDCVIVDGMDGDYMVIGDILFDSGDSRWEPMTGFVEIETSSVDARKADIIEKFTGLMPEFQHLLDGQWKLMTFVHYS